MKITSAVIATIVCSNLAFGCADEPDEIQQIISNLVQAGFPADDIMVADGKVYVGRDAEVSLAASLELLEAGDSSEEQYRTTNLISRSLAKICVNGSTFTGVFSTALDLAIQNYQERPLTFAMARTPSSGCSFTINAVIQPGLVGGSAGFPSGGLPYSTINIGGGLSTYSVDTIEHVITHELGHTIGFRHSDYYNRSISCGGSAVNEESPPTGLGAIHIPGTPTGAVVGDSIMNSCFRSSETGELTTSDIAALRALYAPPPIPAVASVAMAQAANNGPLQVFAIGSNGVLHHNFLSTNGWDGWESMFDDAPSGVTSVAVARGPINGALEVFATTSSGTLYHNFLSSGGWHGWAPSFDGAPAGITSVAMAQGPIDGALEVFARTSTGTLYHNFLSASGWHGWAPSFDGAPAGVTSVALAQGPISGALEVFVTTSSGTLYHNFLSASGWHGWAPSFDGAPAGVTSVALAQGPIAGALEVFARTSTGTLYHNFLSTGGWHGWAPSFDGAPAGVTSAALAQGPISGALETFATTSSGTLYHNFLSSGGWHGWAPSFDGAPTGATSVALAQGPISGALEVFAATSSGTLYHNFLSSGGWHGWAPFN